MGDASEPVTPFAGSTYLKGAAFGLAAASIWAGWSAITRLAVTTSLDASDIAALRFGVAGLLLAPIVLRRGLAHDRLGWPGLGAIVTGLGAPYVLVAAAGLRFAPASDQGALNPGCMPLFVALIAAVVIGERLATTRRLGLALILAGAPVIVGRHVEGWSAGWQADWLGIALISAGVYRASGAPLPRWRNAGRRPDTVIPDIGKPP